MSIRPGPLYLEGVQVGILRADGAYVSRRIAKKHYYIKGGGYPISNTILQDIRARGGHSIIICEERADGTERLYKTTLEKYQQAVLIKEADFDYQRCVPIKEMKVI